MRVLVVFEDHEGGGSVVATLLESQSLKENGHTIAHFSFPCTTECTSAHQHFFTPKPLTIEKFEPLERVFQFRSQHFITKTIKNLRQAILEFKPDVVHFHAWGPLKHPEILKVPSKMNVASVVTAHLVWPICPLQTLRKGDNAICAGDCLDDPIPGQSSMLNRCNQISLPRFPAMIHLYFREFRTLLREAVLDRYINRITCVSNTLHKTVATTRLLPPHRLTSNYSPIQPTFWEYQPDLDTLPQQTHFLALGRFEETKGFMELLEVFRDLPDIPLVLIGDGAPKKLYESYIKKNKMQNVTLRPWLDTKGLLEQYRTSYAVLFPSLWYETFGRITLESFACGKTVIGSDRGAIPELLQHEKTGLLFSPEVEGSLKTQIQRLWNNREFAQTLAQNGHQLYRERFAPERLYEKAISIYQDAIADQQAKNP